jgi:pimeloyl-ACP methyl ester carboxylesterase
MKKALIKIFLRTTFGLLSIIVVLVLFLWIKSPGITDPITNIKGEKNPGSISEINTIELGGLKQYLIIRGADSTKPVMLFVHGGPGGPEIGMMKETNRSIEDDFVMVYWEQRGAGKSYSSDIPSETMNLQQFISDAHELSEYLIKRFTKQKIYIMGHSWGTLLAILTAYKYPDLFYAYFGIGQIAHQYRGELVSFEWVKEQAKNLKNDKAIKLFSRLTFPDSLATNDTWDKFLAIERSYVMKFGGGATHKIRGMLPLVKMVFGAREYTLKDKINYLKGSSYSIKYLWPEVINTNLYNAIDSMQVPVYFLQGIYDYQTSYPVAKDFFNQLKAPQKEFFTFENSAHSPNMEEVEKFNSIIREIAKDN